MIICVGMTLSEGVYIGGIRWPYFSDTGREPPTYYIFAVGLSLTSLLMATSNVLFWHRTYGRKDGNKAARISIVKGLKVAAGCPCDGGCCNRASMSLVAVKLVCVSCICLILTACFSTTSFPNVHQYTAYGFFFLQTVAVALYTTAANNSSKADSVAAPVRASCVRNSIAAVYCLAFLVYLPVGLAVNCEWARLSMDACVNVEELGEAYCESMRLPSDSSLTKLWDYSACPSTNVMRSVTQFICIISLIIFHGLFTIDLRRVDELSEDELELEVPSASRVRKLSILG